MSGNKRKAKAVEDRKWKHMKTINGLTDNTKGILMTVLEAQNPRELTSIKEIRRIDKICEMLEGCENGTVELEDEDFRFLNNRFTAFSTWIPSRETRRKVLETAGALGVEE